MLTFELVHCGQNEEFCHQDVSNFKRTSLLVRGHTLGHFFETSLQIAAVGYDEL